MALLVGYGAVIIGYRPDERGARYPGAMDCGPCISCGSPVYLVQSGQDALRGKGPALVCTYCNVHHHDEIMEAL